MKKVVMAFVFAAITAQAQASQFVSPWVRSLNIPPRSRKMIEDRVESYSRRKGVDGAMRRLAHFEPAIVDYSTQWHVNPEPIFGLGLTESSAREDAVDYVFRRNGSKKAHVGLFQLNYMRLPFWQRFCSDRIKLARRYQKTDSSIDLVEWAQYDIRFDPRFNIRTALREMRGHIDRTGHPTFGFMAHHAGGGDPIEALKRDALERYGIRLGPKDIHKYVSKHKLNYFVLYERRVVKNGKVQHGAAYRYWQSKSDGHLLYGFAPVVWAEVYARWKQDHQKEMLCMRKSIQVAQQKREEKKQIVASRRACSMSFTFNPLQASWYSQLWNTIKTSTVTLGIGLAEFACLAVAVVLLVAILWHTARLAKYLALLAWKHRLPVRAIRLWWQINLALIKFPFVGIKALRRLPA